MSAKLPYRVKPHAVFGPENQYREGQIVELTPEEAKPFLDKLELVGGEDAPLPSDLPPISNELGAEVPDDLKLQSDGIRLQDEELLDPEPEETKPAKPESARKGKAKS